MVERIFQVLVLLLKLTETKRKTFYDLFMKFFLNRNSTFLANTYLKYLRCYFPNSDSKTPVEPERDFLNHRSVVYL